MPKGKNAPNSGRHSSQCSICRHKSAGEIEQAFIAWGSPSQIAKDFAVTRDAVYRHAHAKNLFEPRRRNVRAALERLIERAGEVEVNAAAVVSAVTALAKLNANGQWIERRETVNLNELFERMTTLELTEYAEHGRLPDWFEASVGATVSERGDDQNGR